MKTLGHIVRPIALATLALLLAASFGCASKKASDPAATAPASGLDAKQIIAAKCGSCHSASQADRPVGNRTAAAFIVQDMVNKGAQLTDAEQQAVIDYLAK